jgi:hypothetical protein
MTVINVMDEKTAHKKYDTILRSVKKLVGGKTTYLQQLAKAGKTKFGAKFHGVYPSDRIPQLTARTPYTILNLDRSDQPGSHWIAVAKSNNDIIVYDSFGRTHKTIIPALGRGFVGGKVIDTDRDVEQDIMATDCGARSLSFLVFFDRYGAKNALLI